MCNDKGKQVKGVFEGKVNFNKQIGPRFYRLSIKFEGKGAEAFAMAKPGQFLELKVDGLAIPGVENIPDDLKDSSQRNVILRRPFSFVDIKQDDEGQTLVDILYCVVGSSTVRMTTLKQNDQVTVTGPLGNGFWIPDNKKYAVLVAGGMGAPPLQHLAGYLSVNRCDLNIVAFVGARSADDMPFFSIQSAKPCGKETFELEEFKSCGACSHISTDDGSLGFKGFVTQNLAHWLDSENINCDEVVILSCGPEAMLKSFWMLVEIRGVDCQGSLERRRGCGIGLCQSCAVEVYSEDKNSTFYKLCCKDGPVFDSKEIVW